jgi:tyrosine-protein kinase Etk/Wzc
MALLKDQSNIQTPAFSLDFKRIFHALLVHWYVVIGFVVIALSIATFNYRYVQQIYPVGASIIYLGKEETSSGADLLYKNTLINSRRNYINEPYLMRAGFLVRKVVDELNFDVSFFALGRVIFLSY